MRDVYLSKQKNDILMSECNSTNNIEFNLFCKYPWTVEKSDHRLLESRGHCSSNDEKIFLCRMAQSGCNSKVVYGLVD